jgi:O-antigen/teichoic acid export membrane protein
MAESMARHLAVVFGGRVVFVALSFIATSVILRQLSPHEAGIFWFCLSAIRIVTGCLTDSLDFAVLRSVPRDLQQNRSAALDTLRAAFWLRTGSVSGLLILTGAFAPHLSAIVFRYDGYGYMLVLSAVALIGEILARSAMSYFQASQRFHALVALDITVQAGRFGGVMALLYLGRLSALTALCVWVVVPFISFSVSLLQLPPDVRRPAFPSRAELAGVFRYSRWMVLVMALAAIYERMDVVLLSVFRGPAEVGIYAPAVMLALLPELLVSVVLTVVNPQVARYYQSGHYKDLVRSYLRYSVPIGVLGIAGAFTVAGPVIEAIFGAKYIASIPLFKVLAVGTLVFAMVTPVHSALLSLFAPQRVLVVTVSGLVLMAAGCSLVIPQYGSLGAAVVVTIVRIAMAALIVVFGEERNNNREAARSEFNSSVPNV